MCGTEGIIDIEVCQRSQLLGEALLVFGLLFSEADVFQQDNVAVLHSGRQGFGIFADHIFVASELHLLTQQLGQSCSDRSQREFFFIFTLRSAQVGAEDDLCLMAGQILDGWQRSNDALVVGDDAVLERHIEIAAYQNAFAGYLNIFDGFLVQRIHFDDLPFC